VGSMLVPETTNLRGRSQATPAARAVTREAPVRSNVRRWVR
jgi:hypothetical protein